jgi:hypothetical protein
MRARASVPGKLSACISDDNTQTHSDLRHGSRISPETRLIVRPCTDNICALHLCGDLWSLSLEEMEEWEVFEEDGRLNDVDVGFHRGADRFEHVEEKLAE